MQYSNKYIVIIVLLIAFFISFYDFIFAPAIYPTQNTTRTYNSSGGGFYYGGGSYNNRTYTNNTVRGKSTRHTQRGVGSRGK